jgi:DNA-binding LacI/PurR family transcriptional regulator
MNPRRTTLQDVAKALGVSHTTVALALKNHHRISPARRQAVQRMAKKMGYLPDPFLSGLAAYRKQHGAVRFQGLIAWVNHWNQPAQMRQFKEFDAYWRGAHAAARSAGYQMEEIRWAMDCPPKRFERILLARGVQGLLLPPHHVLLDWGDFDWAKFSAIRFGMSVQHPDTNLVSADHFRAVVMAIRKIHDYGYRKIGLVAGEHYDSRLGGSFTGGFLHAQIALKIPSQLPPLLTNYGVRGAAAMKSQKIQLQQWLEAHQPDAVLTTDAEIPGLIQELGYKIPKDIAVAGTTIYDIPVDAGIDQHPEAIGRIAVEMLVKQIYVSERGEPSDPCRILVESRWQDGKSLPRRFAA